MARLPFNACASTSLATGGWEYIVGLVLATPVVPLDVAGTR